MLSGAFSESAKMSYPSGWMTLDNFVQFLDHFIKGISCSVDNTRIRYRCFWIPTRSISPAVLAEEPLFEEKVLLFIAALKLLYICC